MSNAISYSKAATLECPYLFRKMYLEGLRNTYTAPPLERGKVFHEIMADYVRGLFEQKRETDYDLLREIAARNLAGLAPDVFDDVQFLVEQAERWYSLPVYLLEASEVFTEFKLGLRLENNKAVSCHFDDPLAFFRCVIDILAFGQGDEQNIAYIRDYKTGWNIETPGALERDRQLRWYSYAVLTAYKSEGVTETSPGHIYPRNKFMERTPSMGFELDERVFTEIMNSVTRAANIGLDETHEPRACAMCALCPLQCRLRVEGVSVPPSDPEAASKLAVELEYHEAKLADGKRALKEFAKIHGAVMGASREWAYRTGERKRVSPDALEFIRKHDPELISKIGLSIPAHLLKAKKRADIADGLDAFTEREPYSYFRAAKPSESEEVEEDG